MKCITVALIGLAFSLTSASADIISDFEDGTLQGWVAEEPFGGELFVGTPGNPGQSMQTTDTVAGGGQLEVRAPAVYTGDLSTYSGVSWDEWLVDHGSSTIMSTSLRILATDGTTYVSDNTVGPTDVWTPRLAEFVPGDWVLVSGSSSFGFVIANVEALFIQLDVSNISNGVLESRVDNITLLSGPVPTLELTWGRLKTVFEE